MVLARNVGDAVSKFHIVAEPSDVFGITPSSGAADLRSNLQFILTFNPQEAKSYTGVSFLCSELSFLSL